jgi:hypothetical protein
MATPSVSGGAIHASSASAGPIKNPVRSILPETNSRSGSKIPGPARGRETELGVTRGLWAAVFNVVNSVFRAFDRDDQPEVDVLKAGLKSIDWDADPKVRSCFRMQILLPGEYPTTVLVPYSCKEEGSLEFEEPMEGAEDRDVNRFTFWGRDCAVPN